MTIMPHALTVTRRMHGMTVLSVHLCIAVVISKLCNDCFYACSMSVYTLSLPRAYCSSSYMTAWGTCGLAAALHALRRCMYWQQHASDRSHQHFKQW